MVNNTLIFQCRDEHGPIQIFEDGITRSLHFGSRSRQSAMLLLHPTILVLSYTRAILTSLLYMPMPKRVLILGHGGGSLLKFLLQHFHEMTIDVVELRQRVVDISHQYFQVPESHPRLNIHIADALHFVQGQAQPSSYDWIIVDAFTEQGLAESIHNSNFLPRCRELLTPTGILCLNIWTTHERSYQALLHQLQNSFAKEGIYQIPVRERGNSILMAMADPIQQNSDVLQKRAEELKQRFGIEFPTFINDIYQPNL